MWQPKEDLVEMLLGMGISRNAAERVSLQCKNILMKTSTWFIKLTVAFINNILLQALLNTNNSSAELAAAWLFDNPSSNSENPLSEEEIKKCTGIFYILISCSSLIYILLGC